MLWPIRSGWLDFAPYRFELTALDTEDLNHAACEERFDVVAISAATLPSLASTHVLLSAGASVGRHYGPKLVALRGGGGKDRLRALQTSVIAVPGETTTAALLVKKLLPAAIRKTIPLTPYRGVFDALHDGSVAAAAIIHEGQLMYEKHGCELVCDLGVWWGEETGLPIPVGLNVAHRRLGSHLGPIAAILKRSIRLALDRREDILPSLLTIDFEQGGKLQSIDGIRTYLSLYANEDSYELPVDAQRALALLLGEPGEAFCQEMI